MSESFILHRGTAPLLISLPHDGSAIPDVIAARMTEPARRSPDTDWHVGRLYAFARELGATVIRASWSRYVVDLNRPADGHALYPGRIETGLVPMQTFDGQPIYLDGQAPDADEIAGRVETYWRPYHRALAEELDRLRSRNGRAVLWEGHSIRSQVPMLFDGRLPDMNLGTADGASCAPDLRQALRETLAGQELYTYVVDDRFKGGYNTRHYGRPESGIDAVQLEMAQLNYMDESSFEYRPELAQQVTRLLRDLLHDCLRLRGGD